MRVACVQMQSSDDWQQNLRIVAEMMQQAADAGVQLLLFPENVLLMGSSTEQKEALAQSYSKIVARFSKLAIMHHMHVIVGSLIAPLEGRFINRSLVFSDQGQLLRVYDKIHLFDAVVGEEIYRESDLFHAGVEPETVDVAAWKLGLSICYDLRFPELYRHYASVGCHVLCVPAAFTSVTGLAHWEPLLRSRAIENQCYVLAAGQWGKHADGRQTWGHSMIIDPWGQVLDEKEKGLGLVMADMDEKHLAHIRQTLPVGQHRRLV
ncbi:MAG: carbon-nitrogen hydrolase family protein [Mariprofundaceae bacterium]|nr:carbon-nitrogen hydrolase family protein [Mariprofundaceae bacterium]